MRPGRHQVHPGRPRRRRGLTGAALALVVALCSPLLAACATGDTDALTGRTWYLLSGGERTPEWEWTVPAELQTRYTIRFEKDGTFSSQADCNQLGGAWEAGGSDRLTVTPGPMSMAFCGERSLDVLYAGTLGQVRRWNVASTGLSLTLADGGRLDYTSVTPTIPSGTPSEAVEEPTETPSGPAATPGPSVTTAPTATPAPTVTRTVTATATPTAPRPSPTATSPTPRPTPAPTPSKTATPSPEPTPTPPPGPELTGRNWQLAAFTLVTPAFQGQVPADRRAGFTIEFRTDATFVARADCNTVNGTYSTADPTGSGGSLSLALGAATIVACEEGSYGDLYLTGLENTSAYTLDGGRLTLLLVDAGRLEYR